IRQGAFVRLARLCYLPCLPARPCSKEFPMKRYCALFLVFALTIGPLAGSAQKTAPALEKPSFEMTIDSIMRGSGLFGYPPSAVRWSSDSKLVYFQWKKYDEPREKNMDTYVIAADGSGLKKLSEEEAKDAPPVAGD